MKSIHSYGDLITDHIDRGKTREAIIKANKLLKSIYLRPVKENSIESTLVKLKELGLTVSFKYNRTNKKSFDYFYSGDDYYIMSSGYKYKICYGSKKDALKEESNALKRCKDLITKAISDNSTYGRLSNSKIVGDYMNEVSASFDVNWYLDGISLGNIRFYVDGNFYSTNSLSSMLMKIYALNRDVDPSILTYLSRNSHSFNGAKSHIQGAYINNCGMTLLHSYFPNPETRSEDLLRLAKAVNDVGYYRGILLTDQTKGNIYRAIKGIDDDLKDKYDVVKITETDKYYNPNSGNKVSAILIVFGNKYIENDKE